MSDHPPKQLPWPFSTYDVFGYVIPGAAFLLSVTIFETWAKSRFGTSYRTPTLTVLAPKHQQHIQEVADSLALKSAQFSGHAIPPPAPLDSVVHEPHSPGLVAPSYPSFSPDWLQAIIYAGALLICIYVLGHIIASISGIVIDRILVQRGYGYPSNTLLDIAQARSRDDPRSRFYRGSFFWLNWLLLAVFFCALFPTHLAMRVMLGIPIIATVVAWGIKQLGQGRGMRHRRGVARLYMGAMRGFVWPYDIMTRHMARFMNTRGVLPAPLRKRFRDEFESLFGCKLEDVDSSVYWLTYCFVMERSPALSGLLVNWLHLYSYARNIACAFFGAATYIVASIAAQRQVIQWPDHYQLLLFPLLLWCASLLMLSRYYYLYVCYYSKFLFRSFVYLRTCGVAPSAAGESRGPS